VAVSIFSTGALGAWVLFLPAAYTAFGGWISIITYAIATGLPLFLIAEWGVLILKSHPHTLSLNDYVGKRYGPTVQNLIVMIELVNVLTTLLAEYTAIGDLFEFYVGSIRAPIIFFVGMVTSVYTAMGGLQVSLVTDQGQAILALVLIFCTTIYLAMTFHHDLPTPLPPNLAANYGGFSSIFSLPISLISASVYAESFWQRVWAAKSPSVLRKAGWWSCILTTIVIAFFALVGFLGQWAGLPPLDAHNNLAFFVPFTGAPASLCVLLVVLGATMNESAVDSMQNALVATIASNYLISKPLWWTRVLVFLINVPIMIIALEPRNLLDIFLVMNIITTLSIAPILAGLWSTKLSGITVIASVVLSMCCTLTFGMVQQGGFVQGLKWIGSSEMNEYDYRIFLVAFLSSIVFVVMGRYTIDRHGSYVPKDATTTTTITTDCLPSNSDTDDKNYCHQDIEVANVYMDMTMVSTAEEEDSSREGGGDRGDK